MGDDDQGRVLAFPQAPDAVELRHLRAFVAVAEELNFGRAAERLHISQPALSRQIRALERLLGCELLRRSTHRVELTLAGDALLERSRRLLEDVDAAVSATQHVGGEMAGRLAQLWKPVLEVSSVDAELRDRRRAYDDLHTQFTPPPTVTSQFVNAGGVPAFQLAVKPELAPTILFMHGGGHVLGSAFAYQGLVGALTAAAQGSALAPEFRLAPEHPFPANLEDVVRAYLWILDTGTPPERVVLAGDSAGGSVVMSLLLHLAQQRLPAPGGALFFCPWVDLTGGTLKTRAAADPQAALLLEHAVASVEHYLAGHPIDDPVVSPLTADLTGMPPMLIQGATGDPQVEDAHLLAERARSHGVDVNLELYAVETHAFQTFWSFLPEAMEAVEQAGRFARAIAEGEDVGAAERRRSA